MTSRPLAFKKIKRSFEVKKTRLYDEKGQISSLCKNSSYSDSRLRDLQSNRNFWTEHLLSDSTYLTLFQLRNR